MVPNTSGSPASDGPTGVPLQAFTHLRPESHSESSPASRYLSPRSSRNLITRFISNF